MGRIIHIDLTSKIITESNQDFQKNFKYGRGLALDLLNKEIKMKTDRYDEENCIVFVPGLFSGTIVPSTGRLIVATKKSKDEGIEYINLAGPFSQKIASMNIDAIVIMGKYQEEGMAIVSIDENGFRIEESKELKGKTVTETINAVRNNLGENTSLVGIGPCGETMYPIASFFSTYPKGSPSYYCARGGIGDIFGAKNLKAITVNTKQHFNSKVFDKASMNKAAKELSSIILEHPVCGGALPAYGSITLMKMMKQGKHGALAKEELVEEKSKVSSKAIRSKDQKINRTCAPLCVVGCLNRHTKGEEKVFLAPAESEVFAALKVSFDIEDHDFASKLNKASFELGIDSVEFVFSCSLLLKLLGMKRDKETIMEMLKEIEMATVIGRILGSKTEGIYRLYKDKTEFKDLVTKPSVLNEESFNVVLPYKANKYKELDDLKYLYANMISLENLGFCLFTSFAFFESKRAMDILRNIFFFKTGINLKEGELIRYSLECLNKEEQFEKATKLHHIQKKIPEFVKVLYRYFDK